MCQTTPVQDDNHQTGRAITQMWITCQDLLASTNRMPGVMSSTNNITFAGLHQVDFEAFAISGH